MLSALKFFAHLGDVTEVIASSIIVSGSAELREDGFLELREDGSHELRETTTFYFALREDGSHELREDGSNSLRE